MNGPGVYLILLLPIALSGFPLRAREPRRRRLAAWLSALALIGFCMVGAWTVGLHFAPAAVAQLLAAILLTVGRRGRSAGRPPDAA